MPNSPRAGQPAQPEDLVDVDALLAAYHDRHPDPSIPAERVAFGTSGHRGSSLSTTFNDDHIAATSQAIVEYRAAQGTDGPLFIGRDTHALSEPAWVTACEVFLANDVHVLVDSADGYTPTPAVSTAIIGANRDRTDSLADGVVITPSHNPPARRRLQVQPAARRPGRHRRHQLDRRPRQRAARSPSSTGSSGARSTAARWAGSTSSASTSATCPTSSTSTRSGRRACGSARTRSAGRAWRTGPPSPSATRST